MILFHFLTCVKKTLVNPTKENRPVKECDINGLHDLVFNLVLFD